MPEDLTAQLQQSLQKGLQSLNLELTDEQQIKLITFIELLKKWNRVYNLTAVHNLHHMLKRHILDSLSIVTFIKGARVVDVGAGAGLPGIPLAIAKPDCQFVLVDSNRKKTRFMQQAKIELQLTNLEVVNSRAEDFNSEELFDSVISRALSSLLQMARWTSHLCKKDGVILAMKGTYPESELSELANSFEIKAVHEISYWGLDADRYLVEIQPSKS